MEKKIYKICVFPGDGIGPEVMREALKVLQVISDLSGASFDIREGLVGGAAYERCGEPLPEESLTLALESDAVVLGAVGGPKWDGLDYPLRPERALLGLREKLSLFANLRPVVAFDDLLDASPLKREFVAGIDIMIVRELTGDLYFGKPRGVRSENGLRTGVNTLVYTETEIARIARVGFDLARSRRKNLVSVDKANVLESMQLWRDVVIEVGRDYPDVTLAHMYVDNCAMQLIRCPAQFDVIVTTNMFGDILSDEASMLTGSIGMLPSASRGRNTAMYEPIHGSAPDIAGQNVANPLATILSVAMMLDLTFRMKREADIIGDAVRLALRQGFRTRDIFSEGTRLLGTEGMGDRIVENIKELARQGS
ncbi:MAG: 3-isopropylmalate dehydrogenase [Syntrophus sp. (in: bacteria)]|nr:3-isopropylmalate dehydrogenase [Syntrophus sp. (in: bacteria)]